MRDSATARAAFQSATAARIAEIESRVTALENGPRWIFDTENMVEETHLENPKTEANPVTALETPEAGEVERLKASIINDADTLVDAISKNIRQERKLTALTAELEEARGLLEFISKWLAHSPLGSGSPCHEKVDAYLTRTKPEEEEDSEVEEEWWCLKCERFTSPQMVRFNETHDGCGGECEMRPVPESEPAPKEAGGLVERVAGEVVYAYIADRDFHPTENDTKAARAAIAAVADWLDKDAVAQFGPRVFEITDRLRDRLKAD